MQIKCQARLFCPKTVKANPNQPLVFWLAFYSRALLVCLLAFASGALHAASLTVDLTQVKSWNHAANQPKIAKKLRYSEPLYIDKADDQSSLFTANTPNEKQKGTTVYDPKIDAAQSRVEVILVRKLFNNKNQHVNGLEFDLSEYNLTFDDISSFKLNLLISKKFSHLPMVPQGMKNISPEFIDKLFSPNHHFAVTFYGQFHNKIDVSTTYVKALVSAEASEKASNVVVAAEDMSSYNSQNYRNNPASTDDLATKVYGMIITADTAGVTTLENLMKRSEDFNRRFKNNELYIESYFQLNQLVINTPK